MLALSALLFLAGGLSMVRGGPSDADAPAETAAGALSANVRAGDLASSIEGLQARLERVPSDQDAWAALGLAFVQRARISVDPTDYPRAEDALRRSLSIDEAENFTAHAGMAALSAARHDFSAAREWAQRGLAINPANATLHGALADAETQLGNYEAAFAATQKMVDLSPDTASLARVSYAWELRGDLNLAREHMQRALDDANSAADKAFAHFQLGELASSGGDPAGALAHYEAGLRHDPGYVALLQGRGHAKASLGRVDDAIADLSDAAERAPDPDYIIELGEMLESVGRTGEANEQFRLYEARAKLFESNGVNLDVEKTLFLADHGDPAEALESGAAGIRTRNFVEMSDAYGWALHVNGRDSEAIEWSRKALALGNADALFHFHAGMIERSLGHPDQARSHLDQALKTNPFFSFKWSGEARRVLGELGGPTT